MPTYSLGTNAQGQGMGSIVPDSLPTQKIPEPRQTTLAEDVARAARQGKPGYDIFGDPIKPTVISSANITENVIPGLKAKATNLTNTGLFSAQDGFVRYADGSVATAPAGATQNPDGSYTSGGQNYAQGQPDFGAGYAQNDIDAAFNLQNTMLEKVKAQTDPITASIISNIQAKYDVYEAALKDANERQAQGRNQALLIGGSARYAPLSSEGIVAEGARYGIQQLAELQSKENDAIAAVRSAQDEKDWQRVGQLMTIVENTRKEKQAAAQKVNEQIIEATKKANEAARLSSIGNTVADMMKNGITDPKDLMQGINSISGANLTAIELKDMLDTFNVENPELKEIGKLRETAFNLGAPQEVIQGIIGANNLAEAYKAAGDYARSGTGIIGEFNYARANGYTGDFSQYQNDDANRKRQIINMNAGGLTPQENQSFLTITNKFQADPIINASIKGGQIRALADQIIANPNNTSNQLMALYLFVKNLDPDSAVREGELSLAQQTQSYTQKYNTYLTRISEGQVIAPAAAKELAEATKRLVDTWVDTANRKTKFYQAQAKGSSPNVGNAFNSYVSDSITYPDVAGASQNNEAEATAKIQSISDPSKQSTAIQMLNDGVSPEEIVIALEL